MKNVKPRPKSNIAKKALWGGFSDGTLCFLSMDDRWGGEEHFTKKPALYRTRREAREQFEDVRRVEIREIKNESGSAISHANTSPHGCIRRA